MYQKCDNAPNTSAPCIGCCCLILTSAEWRYSSDKQIVVSE